MSATALPPGDTVALQIPVRLIPGPHGIDSPAVEPGIDRWRWYSWIELTDDRAHRRRSQHAVIEWALGHAIDNTWPAWWLAPDTDAWQIHVAQVADVTAGGQMLLSACLRSAPWTGPDRNVVARADRELTDTIPWCGACRVLGG